MPADTYVEAPDAPQHLADAPMRNFVVSFRIEGKLTIPATDADAALRRAERKSVYTLAELGDLEMEVVP